MPQSEREFFSFQLAGGESVETAIRRSARAKRLRITVPPNGDPVIVAPAGMPYSRIATAAPEFLPWLERMLGRRKILPTGPKFPDAIEIPLLKKTLSTAKNGSIANGRKRADSSSLLFTLNARRALINLEGNSLAFYGHTEDDSFLCRALRAFMRQLASPLLQGRLAALARLGDYEETRLIVRDQRRRWGSCSKRPTAKNATISLNWRAVLLPLDLFDHLCWHELAHLRQMNHSPAFHAELAAHSPDWRQKEKALSRFFNELPPWACAE